MPRLFAALIAAAVAAPAAGQDLPQTLLVDVFPPAVAAGGATEPVAVRTADLDGPPELLFSRPGLTAERLEDVKPGDWETAKFRIHAAADVPAGRYEVAVAGRYGVSNPRAFRVERVEPVREAEPNGPADPPQAVAVNVPVYGTIDRAGDVDVFAFPGEAGRTVVLSCEADSLDSPLEPTLRVSGPDGRPLAVAGRAFRGRTLAAVTLPAAGDYRVAVSDVAYRGGAGHNYRLEIGTGPRVVSVWPPAVPAGVTSEVRLFGYDLPGGQPVSGREPLVSRPYTLSAPAAGSLPTCVAMPPDRLDVDGFDATFAEAGVASPPFPVYLAPRPLADEAEPNDVRRPPAKLDGPAEIAGRFETVGDADRFAFEAKKGEPWVVEAFARRYGSAADPVVTVDRLPAEGDPVRVATADDPPAGPSAAFPTADEDPVLRFEPPEDGVYVVTVRDRYFSSRGGPDLFYRLSIRRPEPDFRLAAVPFEPGAQNVPPSAGGLSVRRGGARSLTVVADRRDGFDGVIRMRVEGPPAGVSCGGLSLGPKQDTGELVFAATADAPAGHATVRVIGEAEITTSDAGKRTVTRAAHAGVLTNAPKELTAPRFSEMLVVSVVEEPVPFGISTEAAVVRVGQGSQVVVPVAAERSDGFQEPIAVAAAGLAKDAKVAVQVKPFAPGESRQAVQLAVDKQAEPRGYGVLFRGTAKIDYARYPGRLDRAKRLRDEATAAVAAADERTKKAAADRDAAVKADADAEAARKTAEAASNAAKQAETKAKQAADQAAQAVKQAAEAVAAAGDDAAKADPAKARLAETQAASDVAARSAAEATAAREAAEKAFADSRTAAEAAKKARSEADAAAKAAEQAIKDADAAKKSAEQVAADAEKASATQKIDLSSPTDESTLIVVPAPATFAAVVPNGGQVKRGETVEIKITATRLNGFDGPIPLGLALPAGAGGLSAEPVAIEAGKTEAVVKVAAAGDATIGDVTFPAVRAEFDGTEPFRIDVPIGLKVVE